MDLFVSWINISVMSVAGAVFLYYYVISVSPAALEKKIGEIAYKKCGIYRIISASLMVIPVINYIIYFFYPLPVPLAERFPWSWWISVIIGVLLAIPAGYLIWRGLKDSGEEAMTPRKEHTMYGGIYLRIRHPQGAGEVLVWWVLAFFLHSVHLAIISFIWLPVWYLMLRAEEKDLVIRYGQDYIDYMKKTGFVLPRFKK
jgi:protein-S-isoprenylcysteine O-methyltransferase Ste14